MTAVMLGIQVFGDRALEIEYVQHSMTAVQSFDPKSPVTAIISFSMLSNGLISAAFTGSGSPSPAFVAGEWHRDEPITGLGDDWDIRATVTAGLDPPDAGTVDTWLALSSNRTWGNTRTGAEGPGTDSSTITFDWRLTGTTTILATVTGTVIAAQQA